jgi:hypothetical protein
MRSIGMAALVALIALGAGCAHGAAVSAVARPRVALLPAESEQFPTVATAVNTSLREAPVDAIGDRFLSKVSLEVVQLSIECVDATNGCFTAVGRALKADRLLLAQIASAGGEAAASSVRVTVVLFDVPKGAPERQASGVFPDETEAARAVRRLVDQVVTGQ